MGFFHGDLEQASHRLDEARLNGDSLGMALALAQFDAARLRRDAAKRDRAFEALRKKEREARGKRLDREFRKLLGGE